MEARRAKLRKEPLGQDAARPADPTREIDVAAGAVVRYTSEDPDYPVDHIFDRMDGPNGTRWLAAVADAPQTLLIEFDRPRSLSRIRYEVVETDAERTQEVRIEASRDGGETYEQVNVQSYNFSPRGSTFQVEDLAVQLAGVSHLKLTIVPNKQGSGRAALTSLRLFGA